jgi:hypothetical protein
MSSAAAKMSVNGVSTLGSIVVQTGDWRVNFENIYCATAKIK